MVEGTVFYKSFHAQKTLKASVKYFDPLEGDKLTPDMCGYGVRLFQFDYQKARIIIK